MGETERKREQQIREKKKQRETRREAQVECAAKVKMTQSAGQNRRTLWHPMTHTHTHTLCCSPKHTHTHRYTVAHGGTHKLWKMAASQLDSVLITLNLIFISGSASLFIFCAVVVVPPHSLSIPFLACSHNRTSQPSRLLLRLLLLFSWLLLRFACCRRMQSEEAALARRTVSPVPSTSLPPSLTPAPPHGRHAVNILDKSFCPFGARSANKKTLIRCRCG